MLKKFVHLNSKNIKTLLKNSTGIELTDIVIKLIKNPCELCLRAKQTKFLFKSKTRSANRTLELGHIDVCDPIEVSMWDRKGFFFYVGMITLTLS